MSIKSPACYKSVCASGANRHHPPYVYMSIFLSPLLSLSASSTLVGVVLIDPPSPSRPFVRPFVACNSSSAAGLFGLQIILPYVIGCLFAIGYGSVVAAGGWEALRVPSTPGGTASSAAGGGTDGGRGDSSGGSGGGDSGGTGGDSGGGDGHGDDAKRDMSFAAQVCAWDNRAAEAAHVDGDEDDEDDDLDSSGPGSDTDDVLDVGDNRGTAAAVLPAAAGGAAAAAGQTRMSRSQARRMGFKDVDAGAPGSARDGDAPARSVSEPMPDTGAALHARGSGQGGAADADAAATASGREGESGGGGGGGGEQLRRVSLVHHASSYDSPEGDDDEEDEEDDSGWGQQVVVKPVKVARWDKRGAQRSKALLSLNQLRACIIERADSTPQKATYRRAAKLVSFFVSVASMSVLGPHSVWQCPFRGGSWLVSPQAAGRRRDGVELIV